MAETSTSFDLPWVIPKYIGLNCMQTSASFPRKPPVKFQLYLFPKFLENGTLFTKIQLGNLKNKRPKAISYRISIVNVNGKKCRFIDGQAECSKTENKFLAELKISREDIINPQNGLLVNGSLKVHCNVKLLPFKAVDNLAEPIFTTMMPMAKHFETLFRSGKFSDAILLVNGKTFKVHKVILARSPVFSAMFDHPNTKESQTNQVEIVDIDSNVCKAFLEYLYTDKVAFLPRYASELLKVADKYQLDDLKSVCESSIYSHLTVQSAVSTLMFADMYQAAELKIKCVKFIIDNAKVIKETDEWAQIINHRPDLLALLFDKLAMKN